MISPKLFIVQEYLVKCLESQTQDPAQLHLIMPLSLLLSNCSFAAEVTRINKEADNLFSQLATEGARKNKNF